VVSFRLCSRPKRLPGELPLWVLFRARYCLLITPRQPRVLSFDEPLATSGNVTLAIALVKKKLQGVVDFFSITPRCCGCLWKLVETLAAALACSADRTMAKESRTADRPIKLDASRHTIAAPVRQRPFPLERRDLTRQRYFQVRLT
jgi:hypothetical protein